ncbi:hypothetical protein PR048_032098 [Dryococelus australis]|uniref:Uncharacterized protein n=1 Tax=Dryococelus australis TaxID=614101 RepID=A0ABQ9G198_9NEOP|nr:hypothetical protein PR048_032098 [Dryococelus australis]
MDEKCLMCEESAGSDASHVSEKGMKTLSASLTRRDGKDSLFRARKTGVVHVECRKQLKHRLVKERDRPQEEYVGEAVEEIFRYLDEQDKDQYSFEELMDQISGAKPDMKWVNVKMVEKYGERIVFSKICKHKMVVCFCDVGEKILNDAWSTSRSNNNLDVCIRVVQTAAAIMRTDIQSWAYDTKSYPPSEEFLNGAEMVPAMLLAVMDALISKRRRSTEEVAKKGVSISHAMISAVPEALPRSDEIQRLTSAPPAVEVGKLGVSELQSYENVQKRGLKNVVVQDVNTLNPIPHYALIPSRPDTLWMCGKWFSGQNIPEMPQIPEWNGYIHLVWNGLKDLLCCAFAPNSVDKMLSGKAYSRAVRGHLLLHTTLVQIILEGASFIPEEQQKIMNILRTQEERTSEKVRSNTTLTCVQEKLNNEFSRLKDNGPTAALWVHGLEVRALPLPYVPSLEVFAGVNFMSGEQHVDFRVSQINRYDQDRGKLPLWLADHPPFAVGDSIMPLSTRVIANSNINCHKAAEIGPCTMGKFVGTNFAYMKQSKKNAVVPLAAMSNTIKLNNETLVVDPLMIFQRTLISKKKDEDVAHLLKSGNEHLKHNFDENMLATVQQENFLANENNKTKLIELLVETLTARRIEASTATGDVDSSIVRCGLNKVTSYSVVVVIGDVDMLILLTALTPPDRNDIQAIKASTDTQGCLHPEVQVGEPVGMPLQGNAIIPDRE